MNLRPDVAVAHAELDRAIAALPENLRARAKKLGFPVLHLACCEGDLELVTALLDRGVDANFYPCSEDEEDQPPLVWLAGSDLEEEQLCKVAKLLIERGASLEEGEPLLAALQARNLFYADFLRAAGAEEPDEDDLDDEDD